MSQQNRTTLKHYFRTGSRPTQGHFADLIDSCLNLSDSDLFEAGGSLGVGFDRPLARLSVNGNLCVSPNNDAAPDNGLFVHGKVGVGAGFANPAAQLAVNGGVYIGDAANTDPGPNGLRVDGDITSGGDINVAANKQLRTYMVRARGSAGLNLVEAGGKGLKINHNSGDVDIGGDLKLANNKSLRTDKVQARDNGGLRLAKRDGGTAMKIHDSGHLSIGTETKTGALVNVAGDLTADGIVRAESLRLDGDVIDTAFKGSTGGKKYGNWIIDVPEGRVVCGIKFERWRDGNDDKDFYTIALRYR